MRIEDEFIFRPDSTLLEVILEGYYSKFDFFKDEVCQDFKEKTYDAYMLEDRFVGKIYEYNTEELVTKCVVSFDLSVNIRDNISIEDAFFLDVFENNENIQTITV